MKTFLSSEIGRASVFIDFTFESLFKYNIEAKDLCNYSSNLKLEEN